jgi:uncharacterized protein YcfJ
MLKIEKMILHLPPTYQVRGSQIGRLVADALANQVHGDSGRNSDRNSCHLKRLAVPPVHISPGDSEHRVAGSIAAAIAGRLTGERR